MHKILGLHYRIKMNKYRYKCSVSEYDLFRDVVNSLSYIQHWRVVHPANTKTSPSVIHSEQ